MGDSLMVTYVLVVRSTDVPFGVRVARLGVTDGPMDINMIRL